MLLTALRLLACVNGVITMVATDPNICPRRVTISNSSGINTQLIFECCPDYIFRDGKCQECPAGKWGQDCLLECMPNYHGVQCRQRCSCLDGKKCDPVHGCICDIGFTGLQCSNACSFGTYGVQCGKECVCAHDAECDPVSGVCLCPAGWFRNHCTKACTIGTYGINCTEKCMCAQDAQCDPVTGECVCHAGWFGDNCSKECPSGKYGINCSESCYCSVHENCDVISGDCNSQKVCHQEYYDYNYSHNCSESCKCKTGSMCDKQSGICECKDDNFCINIMKQQIPKKGTSTNHETRSSFLVPVTVSVVCIPLLMLVCLLLIRQWNHRTRHTNETRNEQGHYDEVNLYS